MIVSHDAALADDNVFQLNVLDELQILVPYVKLDQFTAILFRVTLHDEQLLRVHTESNAL